MNYTNEIHGIVYVYKRLRSSLQDPANPRNLNVAVNVRCRGHRTIARSTDSQLVRQQLHRVRLARGQGHTGTFMTLCNRKWSGARGVAVSVRLAGRAGLLTNIRGISRDAGADGKPFVRSGSPGHIYSYVRFERVC
uniref:Uncharacterized protein n=1 Tax=Sipha flava TaxID=143950 RepID=A0A2S2Q5U3_9HEMI